MGLTASALVQELAKRIGDYSEMSPTSSTIASQIVDMNYVQYAPVSLGLTGNNSFWNAWLYGGAGVDAANAGVTRRAKTWDASAFQATAYTAWPTIPTTGTYEVHARVRRDRKLAAINAAVGQLGFWWQRRVHDNSLSTVSNQWLYTLPNSEHWVSVDRVEMQISVDTTLVGYPYADAMPWNYSARQYQDPVTGAETWQLQFENLPPQPPRIMLVWGTAFYPQLAADTDVMPAGGLWEQTAYEFVYGWATMLLYKWEAANMPSNQSDRYLGYSKQELEDMKQYIQDYLKPQDFGRIIVPGRGDGLYNPAGVDGTGWAYLGSYKSGAFGQT